MTFEVTGLGEHLAAFGALVRLDTRVFPGVAVHIPTRFEAFITFFALIWPHRTVRLFVDLNKGDTLVMDTTSHNSTRFRSNL